MVVKKKTKPKTKDDFDNPAGKRRIEALEGVLKIIRTQAQQRATLAPESERGFWEWVVKAAEGGLK